MKNGLTILLTGCLWITVYSQKVIELPSTLTPSELSVWQGGEREQISPTDNIPIVSNVSSPTLTAYLPNPEKANGTALIIAPGGAFHLLAIKHEGSDVANWCVENGIAAFVLKYRLVPTGENPGQEFMQKFEKGQERMDAEMAPYIDLAKEDGLSAIEYVRQHAVKYKVQPNKIGIIGFSAGGTVAGGAALEFTSDTNRPDFAAPIYAAMHVLDLKTLPENPVPIFMAVTGDDFFGFQSQSIELFETYNATKQAVELHLYEKGQHGFGMKKQSLPSDAWITAFGQWLLSKGFL